MAAAKATRSLVEFMATDKALAGLSKSLTIYGQAFNSIATFASVLQVNCMTLLKHIAICLCCILILSTCFYLKCKLSTDNCLQCAADRCIQISFVAIAATWLDGQPAATEMDLASFASGLIDFENASAVYCPCGKSQLPCSACYTAPGTPPALDATCVLLEH